ncbi:PilZ domain-containing protein [Methylocapsa polymorpha]|uniref:PilZ domain-containing protein n=1 Tax=Methylocapsa polymorpha TaxID=3080828 RepID=A0ABZ0HPI9_9HYPH|nr:PilZ domain-containing protein [Methylocapsa sp. RX1]
MRLLLPEKQVAGGRLHEAVKIGYLHRSDLRHEFVYTVIDAKERGDRRSMRRRRTRLRSGKILDLRNAFLIECQIYDQSDKGARLRLVRELSLPSKIRLYEDASEQLFDAVIVWRKSPEIGICRTADNQARPITRPQLACLRGGFYAVKG